MESLKQLIEQQNVLLKEQNNILSAGFMLLTVGDYYEMYRPTGSGKSDKQKAFSQATEDAKSIFLSHLQSFKSGNPED